MFVFMTDFILVDRDSIQRVCWPILGNNYIYNSVSVATIGDSSYVLIF